MLGFRKIDFRNSKYQGLISNNYYPHGQGILLDDGLRFLLSSWNQGLLNGDTIVFDSHSKYIYGSWKDGLPQGVNVYRGGQTILLANFNQGSITGQFLVIFEAQKIMISAKMERDRVTILSKSQNITKQDILDAANEIQLIEDISTLGSLTGFMKSIHQSNVTGIQISTHGNLQFLGISDGLGILFDDNNFIHKVGTFEDQRQIAGIGGIYTADVCQEGDFETQTLITYDSDRQRPTDKLKYILRQSHLKSITFVNSYILTRVPEIFEYLNNLLKEQILNQLSQEGNLSDSRRFNMNDSLDYHPRDASQNERLKKMRAELYLSIGRPGSQIKPIPGEIINQFIVMEQKEKRGKYDRSSKYSGSKKSAYEYVELEREPTARFEEVNYRQTSPGKGKHLPSMRYTNIPNKTIQRGEVAMWKEESNRIIEGRRSKSPARIDSSMVPRMTTSTSGVPNNNSSSNVPRTSLNYTNSSSSHQTGSFVPSSSIKPTHSSFVPPPANSSTHNSIHPPAASVGPTSLALSRSRHNTSHITASFGSKPHQPAATITNIKYQDIKERRARLLNEYKQIGNRSSPLRISPFRESPRNISPQQMSPSKMSIGKNSENTMYGSPYNDIKSSKAEIMKNSRKQSTDIKTVSRRIDKSEMLPVRSAVKYSYLNSYM